MHAFAWMFLIKGLLSLNMYRLVLFSALHPIAVRLRKKGYDNRRLTIGGRARPRAGAS